MFFLLPPSEIIRIDNNYISIKIVQYQFLLEIPQLSCRRKWLSYQIILLNDRNKICTPTFIIQTVINNIQRTNWDLPIHWRPTNSLKVSSPRVSRLGNARSSGLFNFFSPPRIRSDPSKSARAISPCDRRGWNTRSCYVLPSNRSRPSVSRTCW